MDAGANSTQLGAAASAVSKADLLAAFETVGAADIPEDGQRYIAMSPAGLLTCSTSTSSHQATSLSHKTHSLAATMKEFLGFKIFSTSAAAAGKKSVPHTRSWLRRKL